jgi:photosystem II stability/assembly factor-like uncharacterized protein
MVNAHTGWAIGQDNLWRTTDGGAVWRNVTPLGDSRALFHQLQNQADFSFAGPLVAWMVGGQDYQFLYRTVDGGRRWMRSSIPSNINKVETGTVTNLSFVKRHAGWMVIDQGAAMGIDNATVYRTSDGGEHWTLSGRWHGFDRMGLTALNGKMAWMGEFSPTNRILIAMTTDGGAQWRSVHLPHPAHDGRFAGGVATYAPRFFSPTDGILAVMPGVEPAVTVFYTTQDGGNTWTPGTPLTGGASGVPWSFVGMSRGFASNGRTVYATTDGGRHWAQVGVKNALRGITQLDFTSPRQGWAIAAGRLFETRSGGRRWKALASDKTAADGSP